MTYDYDEECRDVASRFILEHVRHNARPIYTWDYGEVDIVTTLQELMNKSHFEAAALISLVLEENMYLRQDKPSWIERIIGYFTK